MLVYITRKRVKEIREKRICVRGRSIDPEFFPGYREDILNLDWSNVIKAESLNEMWSETEKNIHVCADNYFPVKNLKKRNKRDEWITKDIQKLIVEKNILLLKAKKTENSVDISRAHRQRNYVNRVVNRAKKIILKNYWKKM